MLYPLDILKLLVAKNYPTYIVGGFVRDYILKKPSITTDVDIATKAKPDEIIEIVKENGAEKIDVVGKSFGVVIVDGTEVATFRKDRYNGTGNANLTVEYADTLMEDMQRRDLTINAIAINEFEMVVDPLRYENDVKDKLIRFVGNADMRIKEDPIRMIRACRFLSYIDGYFDPESFKAIVKNKDLLDKVPKERIRLEIMKAISKTRKSSKFFVALYQARILEKILPSLEKCAGINQNSFHSESVFTHNMFTGDEISCKTPLLKLTAYLHDIGKPSTKSKKTVNNVVIDYSFLEHEDVGATLVRKDLEALKFSNEEVDFVSNLIALHMRHIYGKKPLRKTLNALEEKGLKLQDLLRLRIADGKGKRPINLMVMKDVRDVLSTYRDIIKGNEATTEKQLAVDGIDIMKILGIQPGKAVGIAKKLLLEMVLDEPKFNTFEACETALLYWKEHGFPKEEAEVTVFQSEGEMGG